MMTDRNIIINLALDHLEGEGEWLLPPSEHCIAGTDDD
jgi:hypothetical protein